MPPARSHNILQYIVMVNAAIVIGDEIDMFIMHTSPHMMMLTVARTVMYAAYAASHAVMSPPSLMQNTSGP